jgi:hypothetical protein
MAEAWQTNAPGPVTVWTAGEAGEAIGQHWL